MYELIDVTASDEQKQRVLKNLTKMYCYEWSSYTQMDVDEFGKYAFEKYLPLYWQNPERKAFLLRITLPSGEKKWAGFALIDKDFILNKDYDYSLAEFFVLYKYRKQGAGSWMAKKLFDIFPGKWELGRNPKNITAYNFWEHVVSEYTKKHYELSCAVPEHRYIDGTLGDVFAFDTTKTSSDANC